jgi:cbb3-type cytochrome oxidase maturation protein
MSVILILILASLGLALAFLAAFVWAVRAGQYEDTCTPSLRVLMESDAKLDTAAQGTPQQRRVNESAELKTVTLQPQILRKIFPEPTDHL